MIILRKRDRASIHSLILGSAALLVPRSRRVEWLDEWKSELWYFLQRPDGASQNSLWGRLFRDKDALLFSLGAFNDAMWLRRDSCLPDHRQNLWLQSPVNCLLFLAAAAVVAISFFFRSSGPFDGITLASHVHPAVVFAHFEMLAIALLVLPSTTSLALGEYPATPCSPARAMRVRRGIFLLIKFALVFSIVFCGTMDLAPITSGPATLVCYLFAFRWALIDQRRRCPVCLRLLSNPIRIGQPSQIFLEWHGTEYFCTRGHGSLCVPEILTTFSTMRWFDLDSSQPKPLP